jgi:lipoyl(octanoyl) transferase
MAESLKIFRLILSGYSSPYYNMALDQVLADSVAKENGLAVFRVYGWRPYGVSFGFNQKIGDILDLEKCRSKGIPYVRRMTGGGVILHRDDISYSVISRKEDLDIRGGILESYKTINSFLLKFYKGLGLKAAYSEKKDSDNDSGVCSLFKESYDIEYKGLKIGGNAQRRRAGVIFQHGSIPLRDSAFELKELLKVKNLESGKKSISLDKALGRELEFKEAESRLLESFKNSFSLEFKESELLDRELFSLEIIGQNKYAVDEWNLERRDHVKETSGLAQ